MITDTPCLNEKIAPARSRDSGNTLSSKEFPGGMMLITGANSATGLRSTPCRYISCDEVDAFPSDASSEGDLSSCGKGQQHLAQEKRCYLHLHLQLKIFQE